MNKDPVILINENLDIKKLYEKITEKYETYEMSSLYHAFEDAIKYYGQQRPCIRIAGYYDPEPTVFYYGYKDWYIGKGYSVCTFDEFVGETTVKDERWAELI